MSGGMAWRKCNGGALSRTSKRLAGPTQCLACHAEYPCESCPGKPGIKGLTAASGVSHTSNLPDFLSLAHVYPSRRRSVRKPCQSGRTAPHSGFALWRLRVPGGQFVRIVAPGRMPCAGDGNAAQTGPLAVLIARVGQRRHSGLPAWTAAPEGRPEHHAL